MKLRYLLGVALVSVACAGVVAADAAADSATDAGDSSARAYPAAFPKGHYAALDKLPDWGGIWYLDFPPRPGAKRERPDLKGQYLKDYQHWTQEVKATHGNVPHHASYCRPPGMPGIMGVGQYPIEFLFTPGRVTMHFEAWMQWRNIFTDGRQHPDPDDLDPTFYGNSIGHWDGGTLVVDTIGFKTETELGMGMNHSDQMHIIERIHLVKGNPNALVDELTVEDPEALAKPWHSVYTYHRSRTQNLLEFICEENNRNPVNAQGQTEFQ
ncbi:MAG: hypothetical protein ACREUG_09970 [Steroidobacteraceae bacterium]